MTIENGHETPTAPYGYGMRLDSLIPEVFIDVVDIYNKTIRPSDSSRIESYKLHRDQVEYELESAIKGFSEGRRRAEWVFGSWFYPHSRLAIELTDVIDGQEIIKIYFDPNDDVDGKYSPEGEIAKRELDELIQSYFQDQRLAVPLRHR